MCPKDITSLRAVLLVFFLILHLSVGVCGLSLVVFVEQSGTFVSPASDGLDFHLRIDHLQKDAPVCPPSWQGCIVAGLPVVIADAMSLQMLHHIFFSQLQLFFSLFFFWGRTLSEADFVCAKARHIAI